MPDSLSHLPQHKQFDVIIIGGGINGLGIAREAQLRGLKVCVVEKDDIGSGTSAASTRLIHGGLRYLANLKEIPALFAFDRLKQWSNLQSLFLDISEELGSSAKLVAESLRERAYLLKNAPHLVRPLRLVIPTQSKQGFESSRGSHQETPLAEVIHDKTEVRAGLLFYDACSRIANDRLEASKEYSENDFNRTYPFHLPGSNGGLSYYDAQVMLPERLCVENAVDAAEHGACIRTHMLVKALLVEQGKTEQSNDEDDGLEKKIAGVEVEDTLTRESSLLFAPIVVNASGSWVDLIGRLPQKSKGDSGDYDRLLPSDRQFGRMMGGTKGTHIIVKRFPGAPRAYGIYAQARADGRPYFILPWRKSLRGNAEDDLFLIGTTDTKYDGDLDHVLPTRDEIDYLLSETNQLLSNMPGTSPLRETDVLYAYAGVRPLPKPPEEKSAGKITREHIIADHALLKPYAGYEQPGSGEKITGLLSIIGGKLTTYRSLAQDTVDYLRGNYQEALGKPVLEKSPTKDQPLPGICGLTLSKTIELSAEAPWVVFDTFSRKQIQRITDTYHVATGTAEHLVSLYGVRYHAVLALIEEESRSHGLTTESLKARLSETSPCIGAQVAFSIRYEFARTLSDIMRRIGANWHEDLGQQEARRAAEIAAACLGWSEAQKQQEVERYIQDVQERHLSWRQLNAMPYASIPSQQVSCHCEEG